MYLQKGDIIVNYRHKYNGPFNYLLDRLICFFTTEWWLNEKTSKVNHAEMVYSGADIVGDVRAVSQEWPNVKIVEIGSRLSRKAIFRLKNKPTDFDILFDKYCEETLGQPYDWLKLLAMSLFWFFRRTSFAKWIIRILNLKDHDICSEYVARFYRDRISIPCSTQGPNYTTPDDILDYCLSHTDIFETIFDSTS